MTKLMNLVVHLKRIHNDTHDELSHIFSSMEGITNPGIDYLSKEFRVSYSPEVITKAEILNKITSAGYEYSEVFEN